LAECEQMGLTLPGLELASSLYRELQAIGHGQSGTQAPVPAVKQLSDS
jgi:3-hydroxyisobutyrate dehydrogenase-like beta-hydroxyacid dehydrogenase